jgi:superfamily I DNA/RNA helicase
MAKQVMLAVAGAGKTYTICNGLNPKNKNLILAFTHENIHNINKELNKCFGKIPELTNVMTYDAFLYRYILCPFEPTILKYFDKMDFTKKGITTKRPPDRTLIVKGKRVPNKAYKKKEEFEHYELNGRYYCDTLAELILYVKEDKHKLVAKVADCINMFYDQVCIDEFQDFRAYDFDFIVSLVQKLNNVLLVGDYYQHSVSGDNNSGKPFDKMDVHTFVGYLEKRKLTVDTTTLNKSRRCPEKICDFVEKKLGIEFGCNNKHEGSICWLNESNVQEVLENDAIVKLVWNNAKKYSFNAVNWSYSKGDTYDAVCVVLTDKVTGLENEDFNVGMIKEITKNKLYVAITRTKGDLYFVRKEVFDKVKESYLS